MGSEAGAHIFDKLFIDALLDPEKIPGEVEEVAQVVKQEAEWNRRELSILGGDQSEDVQSFEQDISTQPLPDYLEILVRSHLES